MVFLLQKQNNKNVYKQNKSNAYTHIYTNTKKTKKHISKHIDNNIDKHIDKHILTNKYIIVIPSYNRVDIIQVKTLALLQRHNIRAHKINIFVANQTEYDIYYENIPKNLYNKLIIGVIGLKNQRNYIMNYYPEGTHIVQMDDDLDSIVELVDNTTAQQNTQQQIQPQPQLHKETIPITNLNKFILNAFKICNNKNIFLWGVYPLANPYFMTHTTTTDLRFIVGPFWGVINRHNKDLNLTIDEKENSERTLQHWVIDNAVLRFNYIGIKTKYYKNKGGLQSEDKNRTQEALQSVKYLHNKYPQLTKIYLGKKSGIPEIKLISSK